jgi:hypothetical protein
LQVEGQQRLNNILHKLVRLSEIFNIAVVITNQVQSSKTVLDTVSTDLNIVPRFEVKKNAVVIMV